MEIIETHFDLTIENLDNVLANIADVKAELKIRTND